MGLLRQTAEGPMIVSDLHPEARPRVAVLGEERRSQGEGPSKKRETLTVSNEKGIGAQEGRPDRAIASRKPVFLRPGTNGVVR